MDNYKIWAPIKTVQPKKYLYHYTTYETALKILYYKTLRFAKLSRTNDAFEQKPKIRFKSQNLEFKKLFRDLDDAFQKHQENIRILCFSIDPDFNKLKDQYEKMSTFLTKDQVRENVNGRGFALPRMWAQYASNNTGVCLIFEKQKLEECIRNSKIGWFGHAVEYKKYYQPYEISEKQLTNINCGINNNTFDAVRNIVTSNSQYVLYNYFTKLMDWNSEHEYRYITFCEKTFDYETEIKFSKESICGIVIGEKVGDVEKHILKLLLSDSFDKLPLKQIIFEDLTTRIKAITYTKDD